MSHDVLFFLSFFSPVTAAWTLGYDDRLIDMLVAGVPSMHVVIEFLPEMLNHRRREVQVGLTVMKTCNGS